MVLFGGNGNVYNIVRWEYLTDFETGAEFTNCWFAITERLTALEPELMYLNPPDSWEKLEKDLSRTMGKPDAICAYFGCDGGDCVACRLNKESFKAIPYCNPCLAFKDIKERICKLRGED